MQKHKARPKQAVECLECGGTRTLVRENARANDGTIPIRQRICLDCNAVTMTAEIPVTGTTLTRLDEQRRAYMRNYRRQVNGYHGIHRANTIVESDRLDITVRILPGRRIQSHQKQTRVVPLRPTRQTHAQDPDDIVA